MDAENQEYVCFGSNTEMFLFIIRITDTRHPKRWNLKNKMNLKVGMNEWMNNFYLIYSFYMLPVAQKPKKKILSSAKCLIKISVYDERKNTIFTLTSC